MFNITPVQLFTLGFLFLAVLGAYAYRVRGLMKGTIQPHKSHALNWLLLGILELMNGATSFRLGRLWGDDVFFALLSLTLGALEWKRYKDLAQ